MLRWIILAVIVVGLSAAVPVLLANLPTDSEGGLVLARASSERKGPAGKLYVEGDPTHDFGTLSNWATGEKEWTVKNVGQGDLELTMGTSTCMCTVANFQADPKTGEKRDSLTLKPGESTVIKVTWNTKETEGRFTKQTSIHSNDPGNDTVVFEITGDVQPALMTMPPVVDYAFGRIQTTDPQKAPLIVGSADKPGFKITEIVSSNPDILSATVTPLEEAEAKELKMGGGYKLEIQLKPSPEIGAFREELVLKTDHPKRPELKVPVHGRRIGPIDFVPEATIRIPSANTKSGGERSLVLSVKGQESTNFEVVEKPEHLNISISPAGDPNAAAKLYKLTATIPPDTPPGTVEGTVVIKTDHPQAAVLKIPVSAVVLSDAY